MSKELIRRYHNLLAKNNKIDHSNHLCGISEVYVDSSKYIFERLETINKSINDKRKIDILKFIEYIASIDYRFDFYENEVVENFIKNRLWKKWKLQEPGKEFYNKENQFAFSIYCFGNAELNIENDYNTIYVNAIEEDYKLNKNFIDIKEFFNFIKTIIDNNLLKTNDECKIVSLFVHSDKKFTKDYVYFSNYENDKLLYYLLLKNEKNLTANIQNFFNAFIEIYLKENNIVDKLETDILNKKINDKEIFLNTLIKFFLKCRFKLKINVDVINMKKQLSQFSNWENVELIKLCFVIVKIVKEILNALLIKMI